MIHKDLPEVSGSPELKDPVLGDLAPAPLPFAHSPIFLTVLPWPTLPAFFK